MTENPRDRVVADLRVLWPYLNFAERWTWIERIRPLFPSFADAVRAVTEGLEETLTLMAEVAERTRENPPDLAGALDEMRDGA